jgi:hypothetical protein
MYRLQLKSGRAYAASVVLQSGTFWMLGRVFLWISLTHETQIVSSESSWDSNKLRVYFGKTKHFTKWHFFFTQTQFFFTQGNLQGHFLSFSESFESEYGSDYFLSLTQDSQSESGESIL